MASEVLGPSSISVDPTEERILRGSLLDMWQLYQRLSVFPDRLSDLTIPDFIDARKGMVFPDFFNAVHELLSPNRYPTFRMNTKPHPEGVDGLEAELDETFHTMDSKWASYEPFFERHPELKYLRELSPRGHEMRELGVRLPFLRGIGLHHLWSIVEYYRLRGNLDPYVALDAAISKNQGLGTLFEEDSATYPGDFMVYLFPYGKAADKITKYLPLLKHGDLIGFGTIALAEVNGQQFVAITSLQTDLLRKDRFVEATPETRFALGDIRENSDGRYTVPGGISKHYLAQYDWAHRLVSAVENAVLEMSELFPVSGVIMPVLATYGADSHGINEFERLSFSRYASGLYESFPGERGYHQRELSPVFPLTERWKNGAVSGSGKWWVKPIGELR